MPCTSFLQTLEILIRLLTPIPLEYSGLSKLEKTTKHEYKYARKVLFERCAKINTREINQCLKREPKSAQKLVRIRYNTRVERLNHFSPL